MQKHLQRDHDSRYKYAMSMLRKYPKLIVNYNSSKSIMFNRFRDHLNLNESDALKLLREVEQEMYIEIPEKVTERYMNIDWSPFPLRAAQALWVLIDEMHNQGSRRVIIPQRLLAKRMGEASLQGWTSNSSKSIDQAVAGRALKVLQKMGFLDELTPGEAGLNDWSGFYKHNATIVELTPHPESTILKVRGHKRPDVWSVSVQGWSSTQDSVIRSSLNSSNARMFQKAERSFLTQLNPRQRFPLARPQGSRELPIIPLTASIQDISSLNPSTTKSGPTVSDFENLDSILEEASLAITSSSNQDKQPKKEQNSALALTPKSGPTVSDFENLQVRKSHDEAVSDFDNGQKGINETFIAKTGEIMNVAEFCKPNGEFISFAHLIDFAAKFES